MSRGNPENLRKAAHAKQAAATERAERGLRELIKAGQPITFQAVAAAGRVSKDFLYRTPELRSRITQLRNQQDLETPHPPAATREGETQHQSTSSIVRTLTTKLTAERAQHRSELNELRNALAAAHGEILTLKRQQGHSASTRPENGNQAATS